MKTCTAAIFAAVISLATAAPLCAGGGDKQHAPELDLKELQANYDKKMQLEFVKKISWNSVLRAAIVAAKQSDKPVLAYFTRSDRPWPPADELEEKVLLSDWWLAASQRFVPYLNVQTGGLKLPEEPIISKVVEGNPVVPLFVLLDLEGNVITTFVLRDAASLERAMGEAEELLGARRDVRNKAGELAKKRLGLIEGLRAKKPNFEALAKLAAAEGMDTALVDRFNRLRNRYPVVEALAQIAAELDKQRGKSNDSAAEEVRKDGALQFLKLYREKGIRIEDRNEEVHKEFWQLVFQGAILAKDKKVAGEAFAVFERAYGNEEGRVKDRIAKMREELANLR